jgi:hypothetical protein
MKYLSLFLLTLLVFAIFKYVTPIILKTIAKTLGFVVNTAIANAIIFAMIFVTVYKYNAQHHIL